MSGVGILFVLGCEDCWAGKAVEVGILSVLGGNTAGVGKLLRWEYCLYWFGTVSDPCAATRRVSERVWEWG